MPCEKVSRGKCTDEEINYFSENDPETVCSHFEGKKLTPKHLKSIPLKFETASVQTKVHQMCPFYERFLKNLIAMFGIPFIKTSS